MSAIVTVLVVVVVVDVVGVQRPSTSDFRVYGTRATARRLPFFFLVRDSFSAALPSPPLALTIRALPTEMPARSPLPSRLRSRSRPRLPPLLLFPYLCPLPYLSHPLFSPLRFLLTALNHHHLHHQHHQHHQPLPLPSPVLIPTIFSFSQQSDPRFDPGPCFPRREKHTICHT